MVEKRREFFLSSTVPAESFAVDDLLVDYPNDDDVNDAVPVPDADPDVSAVADSSNSSSFSGEGLANLTKDIPDGSNFSGDLCVPYDDLAELEWLSNFVEESFSGDNIQRLPAFETRPDPQSESTNISPNPKPNPSPRTNSPIFNTDVPVPAKARSKRSRAAAGFCSRASRGLLVVNPYKNEDPFTQKGKTCVIPTSNHHSPLPQKKSGGARKKKGSSGSVRNGGEDDERRCLHCATHKTPQWRTGPMGPKTLCNACGVRYKSGRLVPEYRPAASPTFVLTKHSNSHRKVMELRRQKETTRAQQQFLDQHQTANMIFDVSSDGDDYLIHQQNAGGPEFRQMI